MAKGNIETTQVVFHEGTAYRVSVTTYHIEVSHADHDDPQLPVYTREAESRHAAFTKSLLKHLDVYLTNIRRSLVFVNTEKAAHPVKTSPWLAELGYSLNKSRFATDEPKDEQNEKLSSFLGVTLRDWRDAHTEPRHAYSPISITIAREGIA